MPGLFEKLPHEYLEARILTTGKGLPDDRILGASVECVQRKTGFRSADIPGQKHGPIPFNYGLTQR